VSEYRVLMAIFGPKGVQKTAILAASSFTLFTEYFSHSQEKKDVSRICRENGEIRNADKTLVGILEGKRPLPAHRGQICGYDNIKMNLREICLEAVCARGSTGPGQGREAASCESGKRTFRKCSYFFFFCHYNSLVTGESIRLKTYSCHNFILNK
jgi:hypothetical protein